MTSPYLDRPLCTEARALKAWHVDDSTGGAPLLVFAETQSKARSMACNAGLWEYEYLHTQAWRAPAFDTYATERRVIEQNKDLPNGARRFYSEDSSE